LLWLTCIPDFLPLPRTGQINHDAPP